MFSEKKKKLGDLIRFHACITLRVNLGVVIRKNRGQLLHFQRKISAVVKDAFTPDDLKESYDKFRVDVSSANLQTQATVTELFNIEN